jgi:16S rRNA (guanine527-N7)-methyltransferase
MFHVKHPAWVEDAGRLGIELSHAQWDALDRFRDLLVDGAIPRGMIAAADADRLWSRHIRDGLRGASWIAPETQVADLGSGAGIPGLPLAIARPKASFVLMETRRARASFLESVVDDLALRNVEVFPGRVESWASRRFDVAVARALAPPRASWAAAATILASQGRLVYWAGTGFDVTDLEGIGVSARVSTRSGLADDGPLVIMARQ